MAFPFQANNKDTKKTAKATVNNVKTDKARKAVCKKSVYKVKNWAAYNQALTQRGNLTIWISEDVAKDWYYNGPKKRGGQKRYADLAIETGLTLRLIYNLALRQAEGFITSLIQLAGLTIQAPDYTTFSRRQRSLDVRLSVRKTNKPRHVVVDSTGVKVYGEGEWKVRQHGVSKRRTWRKLHLAVDETTKEILAVETTTNDVDDAEKMQPLLDQIEDPINAVGADGAYDKDKVYSALIRRAETQGQPITILIPPRRDAVIWQHGNCQKPPHPRDENLRSIRKNGRKKWKEESGYHRRSISETTMFRYKSIISPELKSRKFENQIVETRIGCKILNRMTLLGMPISVKAA